MTGIYRLPVCTLNTYEEVEVALSRRPSIIMVFPKSRLYYCLSTPLDTTQRRNMQSPETAREIKHGAAESPPANEIITWERGITVTTLMRGCGNVA